MQRIPNFLSRFFNLVLVVALGFLGMVQLAGAQDAAPSQDSNHQHNEITSAAGETLEHPTENFSAALNIGPGDEVEITVYGAPDLSVHARVGADGNVSMPLIDYVRIAGLSSTEAEAAVVAKLRQNNIMNDPQVAVYVKEYSSGGISVAGEVSRPGVYSAQGPHRLFDILQMAGGLSERASGLVTVTHRGEEKNPITVEVSKDPAKMARSNVALYPGDTVFVVKAPMVYVLGEVNKPGAYILNSTGAVTVLQLVASAGGPTHAAAVGGARMVRRTPSGLEEHAVPLKSLLRGKGTDIPVSPDDILFIPSSRLKTFVAASTVVATSTATAAVYHVF